MRNRNDEISVNPNRSGVRCDWVDTRPIHLCSIFPVTARWLLRRALQGHPIRLKQFPDHLSRQFVCSNGSFADMDSPEVSFLIGHRGMDRLPLLLATLRSIAAQENVSFECVVVEQDQEPLIKDALPKWVRYVHTPLAESGLLYNRSRAFNDAAQVARGRIFILHDNDMLIPSGYAAETVRIHQQGAEVAQLKRFVFYLDKPSSEQACMAAVVPRGVECEQVIENLCGGGSLTVSAQAYREIGGMDEEFIGWGGEDEEFWNRCQTRKVWEHGFLTTIHLWHTPQPGKRAVNGQGEHTAELTARRMAIPAEDRIAELVARQGEATR